MTRRSSLPTVHRKASSMVDRAALRRAVIRVKPKLHCFGHIHSAYGVLPTKNTLFVNAALLDEDGAPSRRPILLNFSGEGI
jgi:Icc-related predicted phosphoesterase